MKVLIVDDHAVFRDGLKLLVSELPEQPEILEAANADEAHSVAKAHSDLDLVLMDLEMPGGGGMQGLQTFREHFPSVPVVICSASDSATDMRAALDAGSSGYLPKSMGSKELRAALGVVLAGSLYIPAALLDPKAEAEISASKRRRARADVLTTRQIDVLALIARGLTNREICGVLEISENTVKTHVKAVLEALEVTNRTEAAILARELDLRSPGEEQ
ncbi:MAG: response regulator [Myxococcota bacterium]